MIYAIIGLASFALGWAVKGALDAAMTRIVTRIVATEIGKKKVLEALAKFQEKQNG